MSEGIVIALITAVGSLLGGIIGQIITASATIEAAKIKDKAPTIPNNGTNDSWKRVVVGAIIGAVVTLVILFSLGMIPSKPDNPLAPEAENTPNAAEQSQTPSPTKSEQSILFAEDFEDGKTQQMTYVSSNWKIVTDETGNKVYDIDHSNNSKEASIDFGSNLWKDYELKFRVRVVSGSSVPIFFRIHQNTYNGYLANIEMDKVSLYDIRGWDWVIITSREHHIRRNVWYWVRITARGSEIVVSIDNNDIISTENTLYDLGYVNIQVSPYTHAQFDDIEVRSLEK